MSSNTLSQRRRRLKFYLAGRNSKGEPYQRKPRVVIVESESDVEPTRIEKEWAKLRSEMTHQEEVD